GEMGTVGQQAAGEGEKAIRINGRQPVAGRQRDDAVAAFNRQRAWQYDQPRTSFTRKRFHHALDLGDITHTGGCEADAERKRGRLKCAHIDDPGWVVRIEDDGNPADSGTQILERLRPFSCYCRLEIRESRDIATRVREARNEPDLDRVGDLREHDWD